MTNPNPKTKGTVTEKKESRSVFYKKILPWVSAHYRYIWIFLVPFLIMYVVYALFKVHPYGENSVLVLDLNGQYVYFYEAFRDAFWGRGSFIYNWSRNLSGEMFGIFAYYLASPFMIIICLLPRTCMLGAIELMQLAKIGAASITFAFYLKKTSKGKQPEFITLLIFSTMYALCSYMVVELMDPMWLDGLVYLPLIFWGVHRLIDDGVMLPYIIPLTLMFIAHFYIGYMVGIFTFLYFVCYSFSHEGRILPKGYIGAIGRFVFGTFTAIMSAMWVLIPVYKSLSLGKLEFSEADFTIRTQFKLLEFTSKMFPLSYDTVRPEGLPMIYGGILVVILLPLFFLNSKISMKEKVSRGLLLLSSVVIMYIAPIDIAMHGFQVPNWLPYRYSFVFTFLAIYMAFRAFQNLDGITTKELGAVFFGLMAFLVYLDGLEYEHFTKLTEETVVNDTKHILGGVWFSAIAVGIGYLLIYLVKKYRTWIVSGVLCAAVCVEMFVCSYDTVKRIDKDVGYSSYTFWQDYMINLRATVKEVKEYDSSPFYRMESTYHRMVDDPIGTGYYGVTHSSSTMNTPALMALHKLGYAYGGNYTKYQGTTMITDAFFGIKYVMNNDDPGYKAHTKIPEEYEMVIDSANTGKDISVYKNPYALGLGFAVNSMMEMYYFDEDDPFVNQNNLLNYAIGIDELSYTEYMQRVFPEQIDTENLATVGVSENHTKYYFEDESIGECHEDFVFTMPSTSHLYMYFPTMYERKVNVWVAHDEVFAEEDAIFDFAGYFFTGDDYSILDLGEYNESESVRVRVSIPLDVGEAYWRDTLFYVFDKDAFKRDIALIDENRWELTEFSETYLEGKITLDSDQFMLTTIPYEEGWIIKVDGEEVEPIVVGETFIGVKMSPGTHTVSMRFRPNYFIISVILSVCGVLIMVIVFVFEYKKGKLLKKLLDKIK